MTHMSVIIWWQMKLLVLATKGRECLGCAIQAVYGQQLVYGKEAHESLLSNCSLSFIQCFRVLRQVYKRISGRRV
jgi:hypothetical protein